MEKKEDTFFINCCSTKHPETQCLKTQQPKPTYTMIFQSVGLSGVALVRHMISAGAADIWVLTPQDGTFKMPH